MFCIYIYKYLSMLILFHPGALQNISGTVVKCKQIVEYFKRSSQAQHKLVETQKQQNLPQLKLKQDVVTRWNSTYDMLQRMLIVKDAVITTVALTRSDLALTEYDWCVVESAIPILKLFYDVTTELSAEKNVTLSKVIPLVRIMLSSLRSRQSDLPEVQSLIKELERDLERRFATIELSECYAEAIILDPRFKTKGFRDERNCAKALASLKLKVGRSGKNIYYFN